MLTVKQKEALLRLFKSYLYGTFVTTTNIIEENQENVAKSGLVFTKIDGADKEVIDLAIQMFGKKPEEWNQTFHKSFKTVLETPIEVLIAQQVIHYFTTYGLESLDLYNENLVYIPNEKLEIPELEEDIPLIVIKDITEDQLKEKMMKLLTSGIALSKQTIEDIMLLSDYIDQEQVDDITNKEVRIAMFEKYNLVPKSNIEFLRYLIFKATGETLLIKNKHLIKKIKEADADKIYNYLNNYIRKPHGYEHLAEIFLRFKDLFLAFKREKGSCSYAESINKIINRLDKLARIKGYHRAIGKGILDNITSIKDESILALSKESIEKALDQTTIFREVSIVNSLRYRETDTESILYKVRNGKAYADTLKHKNIEEKWVQSRVLDLVYGHLKKRINKLLCGKKVYLPNYIDITVPTSEKQYIGYLPYGTSIQVPRLNDMIVGVHWKNFDNERIDLDIHTMNMNQSFGWNTGYRSETGDIAFSGDVTDAILPKGATELFAISKRCNPTSFLLTINDYTRNSKNIPFELILASEKDIKLENNYTINPNKVLISVPCLFDISDDNYKTTLGLIKVNEDNIEFIFNKFDMGSSIITSRTNVNKITYDYLDKYSESQLTLRQLLTDSLIEISDEPYTEELQEVVVKNNQDQDEILYKKIIHKVDYDLSLDKLDKTTIIDMLTEEI